MTSMPLPRIFSSSNSTTPSTELTSPNSISSMSSTSPTTPIVSTAIQPPLARPPPSLSPQSPPTRDVPCSPNPSILSLALQPTPNLFIPTRTTFSSGLLKSISIQNPQPLRRSKSPCLKRLVFRMTLISTRIRSANCRFTIPTDLEITMLPPRSARSPTLRLRIIIVQLVTTYPCLRRRQLFETQRLYLTSR